MLIIWVYSFFHFDDEELYAVPSENDGGGSGLGDVQNGDWASPVGYT